MGKGSRRRKRRRRKESALARREGTTLALPPALARPGSTLRIELRMEQLELAKGYDGLLRGAPEPAVVVAVYRATAARTLVAGRYLYRFERPSAFPCKVATRQPSHESCVIAVEPGARLVLLAVAIEEDSGRGLQAIYGELERADAIMVWAADHGPPVPQHLWELEPHELAPDLGHRVHLLIDGLDPTQHLPGDDFVDAALLHGALAARSQRCRLRFCAVDGRNDWTAELLLALRPA